MKKSRLAPFILLAPLTMLCACGGLTPLTFEANWYANTANKENITGTHEQLEYEVTFEGVSGEFTLSYDKGTYQTELIDSNSITLSDGTVKTGYVYTTELNLTGRYSLNGTAGEDFHDRYVSTVEFLHAGDGLKPVRSRVEAHATAPRSSLPSDIETALVVSDYTVVTEYKADLTGAKVTLTGTQKTGTAEALDIGNEKEINIDNNGTYLDNEQILFALRGVNLATASTLRSYDWVEGVIRSISVGSATAADYTPHENLTLNGTARTEAIPAYTVSFAYNGGTNTGATRSLTYARTASADANTFRNVLLAMDVPVMQNLGTIHYKLVKAEFANK